jgi:PKD repeat protein
MSGFNLSQMGKACANRLVLLLAPFFICFQACASDYVIVVDTSGSMTEAISKSDPRIRITTVQQALANYLKTLPRDSRVYLLSFNTGIRSEKEFILRADNDLQAALAWVSGLGNETRTGGNTHLWTTLQRALEIATAYAKQNADQTVVVRALTDGMDNEGKTSLDAVLGRFPLLDGKSIRANLVLLGDLEVKLKQAREGFEIEKKTVWTDLFPPVIQWKPAPVIVGQETSFYDNSQSVYQNYEWLIDGKSVGNQKVFTHRFAQAGRYRLKLVAVGTSGLRTYSEVDVQVVENDLTVDFVVSQSEIEPNQEVKFFSRVTGKPSSFSWSVDGKESATQQDFTAKFETEGDREVKLVVRDAFGKTASRVRTVRVKEPEVVVSFKAPKDVMTGQAAQFVNECTGNIANFEWDFGDGQKSNERHPTHAYKNDARNAENRQVVLRVTTATGKTFQSAPFTISVLPATIPPAPQAAFRILGESPHKVGLLIQLMDESTGMIDSYSWSLGGEFASSQKNPEFTPGSVGEKIIRQIVNGPGGNSTNEQKIVVVPRYVQPVVTISASPSKTRLKSGRPADVAFKAEITGDYDALKWEFGDGTTSAGATPTNAHAYAKEGAYTIQLTARNPGGQEGKATLQIHVLPPPPWYYLVLKILGGAFAAWVLIIVPFFLQPAMLPHKTANLRSSVSHNLRLLAKRRALNWLWPRSFITIGTQKSDDIRLASVGSAKKTMAVVTRLFGSENYQLIPGQTDAVKLLEKTMGGDGKTVENLVSINSGKGRILRDGDQLRIADETLLWSHSTKGKKKT